MINLLKVNCDCGQLMDDLRDATADPKTYNNGDINYDIYTDMCGSYQLWCIQVRIKGVPIHQGHYFCGADYITTSNEVLNFISGIEFALNFMDEWVEGRA